MAEKQRRWLLWLIIALLALVAAELLLRRAADTHLRAMSLLLRFSDPKASGFSTSFARQLRSDAFTLLAVRLLAVGGSDLFGLTA